MKVIDFVLIGKYTVTTAVLPILTSNFFFFLHGEKSIQVVINLESLLLFLKGKEKVKLQSFTYCPLTKLNNHLHILN